MKLAVIILPYIIGSLLSQIKSTDKELYYFFSPRDTAELKAELKLQGMTYRPMFVVLESDTLEVSQISINDSPYRNTDPKLICIGIPANTIYDEKGIFIFFKKFNKIGGIKNE